MGRKRTGENDVAYFCNQTAEEVMVISVDLAQLNDAELTLKHTDGELPAVTATALTAALGNGKAKAEARAAAEAEVGE